MIRNDASIASSSLGTFPVAHFGINVKINIESNLVNFFVPYGELIQKEKSNSLANIFSFFFKEKYQLKYNVLSPSGMVLFIAAYIFTRVVQASYVVFTSRSGEQQEQNRHRAYLTVTTAVSFGLMKQFPC